MNSGQLAQLLRGEFLVDVESYTKLEGKPLFAAELERESRRCCEGVPDEEGLHVRPGDALVPGCGDYAVLASVQQLMPELGVPPAQGRVRVRDRLRRPFLVLHGHDGMHGIHGRAPALATGLAAAARTSRSGS